MAFVPFNGELDPVDQIQSPQGLKPFAGQLDGAEQDNALTRGISKSKSAASITSSLATGDAAGAAQRIRDAELYDQRNPGTPEGKQLMQAWDQGDGIVGGIKGVAGEFAKDFQEAPGLIGGLRATGKNLSAMGGGLVEQLPNMVAPMGGMIAGGLAGSLAGPVGTVGGAFAGATAGNTLMEGREQVSRALQSAGIDPTDTQAVESYLKANGDSVLGTAFTKGAIIGGVDTLSMGLGNKILRGPASAAADRALAAMGVDVADKAAVQAAKQAPEFVARLAADAQLKAATTGAQGVARNVGTAALEPAGEFAGEYLGQGVATGDWDTKGAALEALSSLGQSGVTFAGQKAYQAVTNPLRGQQEQAQPAIDPTAGPLSKAASMATQTPELAPLAFTPQQPTGPELETDAQTQERMRAAQFAADAMPFERPLSFEQPAQPVRQTTSEGMPFERIGPEDYDTLNPIRVGEGELLDRERPAQGQTRAPDAIGGQEQRRIGVADDGQQDQGAPERAIGGSIQPPQAAQGAQRALPSFTDQKAEVAARKSLPFANEPAAQKKADELAQKRSEPFSVIPHPALANRFAVVPMRNLMSMNEQGQAAQLAARAQAGQPGAMPRVEQGAQQSAPDGLAATAPATSVQTQPATESVSNDLPPAQKLAQEAEAARGQEGTADGIDNPRLRRASWRSLGADVSAALPANASRMRPQPRDFLYAASALGVDPSDAALAWNVFTNDDTPTPRRKIQNKSQKIQTQESTAQPQAQQAPASSANASLIDEGKTAQPQAQQGNQFGDGNKMVAQESELARAQGTDTAPVAQAQGERNGLQEEGRRKEVAPKPKNQTLDSLQAEYDKAKSALDAIGPEPYQPKKRGSNPTEEDAKAFDEAQKRYRSWRNKYLKLKKAEVDASNRLFYAKKAEQQQSETTAREEAQAEQSPSDRFRAEVGRRKQEREGPQQAQEQPKQAEQSSAPATEERQAEQAESLPVNPELESLFESLDGTSTRKANKAKKAIQADPRADKINMVQDKFLDILQALEDSGAVKINCK